MVTTAVAARVHTRSRVLTVEYADAAIGIDEVSGRVQSHAGRQRRCSQEQELETRAHREGRSLDLGLIWIPVA